MLTPQLLHPTKNSQQATWKCDTAPDYEEAGFLINFHLAPLT